MRLDDPKRFKQIIRQQICLGIATATALFALVVGVLLVINQQQISNVDPLQNTRLAEMKKEHQADPQNETLKAQLREYDQQIRQEYFTRSEFRRSGSYLLVGSLALMLLMLHLYPRPITPPSSASDISGKNHNVRALACLLVAAFTVSVLYYTSRTPEPFNPGASAKNADNSMQASTQPAANTPEIIPAGYLPDEKEWQSNWPCFRGPLQNGTTRVDLSAYNTATVGKTIWQAKLPHSGLNSPIIWGDHVFMSGASNADTQQVYCYNLTDGKELWTTNIRPVGGDLQKRREAGGEAGLASPTMITDGKRVCSIFATGDLVCLDFSGSILWQKNIGVPSNHYGYSSSLTYHKGKVFVQWDNENDRSLLAFNIADGTQIYKSTREDAEMSWSSPVILQAGDTTQLILCAAPSAIAYNPEDGKELWRCETLTGEVAPAATTNGKLFFIAMQYSNLTALTPDSSGKVSENDYSWQFPDNIPDTSSPLATGEYVILSDSAGFITCVNAKDGKLIWEEVKDSIFYPSPTLIGDHVWQLDTTGNLFIFAPLPEYKETATAKFSGQGGASPAIKDGKVLIRCGKELYCIELEKK